MTRRTFRRSNCGLALPPHYEAEAGLGRCYRREAVSADERRAMTINVYGRLRQARRAFAGRRDGMAP